MDQLGVVVLVRGLRGPVWVLVTEQGVILVVVVVVVEEYLTKSDQTIFED